MVRAFIDLNDLLTKGYPINASMTLVGNHHRLNKRQREALNRASAPQQLIERILENEHDIYGLKGKTVYIDGFNLIILLESALSGAYIFECADGTFRDLSGVHGSYKRVNKTNTALKLIGTELKKLAPAKILWILDEPVSNSGRLKSIMNKVSAEFDFGWEIILDKDPDGYIARGGEIGISSDSWILERTRWINFGRYLVEKCVEDAAIFRFGGVVVRGAHRQ